MTKLLQGTWIAHKSVTDFPEICRDFYVEQREFGGPKALGALPSFDQGNGVGALVSLTALHPMASPEELGFPGPSKGPQRWAPPAKVSEPLAPTYVQLCLLLLGAARF